MFSPNAAICICREPWDNESGARQRIYAYAAKGLVLRVEGTGRDIRFAARDLAAIRTLEAGRVNTERADTELLTAISEAMYFRRAPDGTHQPGAPIYWAARALLDGSAEPMVSAARIVLPDGDKPEWKALVHDSAQRPDAPKDSQIIALFAIPLARPFSPVLPYFNLEGGK